MAVKKLDIPVLLPNEHDCDHCIRRFQDRIKGLPGVCDVEAGPKHHSLSLTFDPDSLSMEELQHQARQIGLDIQRQFGHETFAVEGLTCADCARLITATAQKVPGVITANTSYPSAALSIEYETGDVDLNAVIKAVEKLGYSVQLPSSATEEQPSAPLPAWRNSRAMLTIASGSVFAAGLVMEFALAQKMPADALYAISGLLVAFYVYRGAWAALKAHMLETDFLMGAAALGAVYLGDWREAAAVLFLYTMGETLEALTVSKARGAIRWLVEGFPQQAAVLVNGEPQIVPTAQIEPGNIVLLRPGERSAVDGEVVSGVSEMDESLVSGESLPRAKSPGDQVFAGSLNGSGALEVRCIRLTRDNTVNRIIHMVEGAQSRKSPSQRVSERFGRVYTPIVIVLAAAITVLGPLVFGQPFLESFRRALILLTVSCPCALILSAPVAVVSALAAGAKNGLLIKGGSVLENLGQLRVMCFDKTGTLTLGKLVVTDVEPADGLDADRLLIIAASIESRSEHLIGQAVVRYAAEKDIVLETVDNFQAISGKGASAQINGTQYFVGSAALFSDYDRHYTQIEQRAAFFAGEGKTALFVGSEGHILGAIAVQDTARTEAASVIARLKELDIQRMILLTGDHAGTANRIRDTLQLHESRAGLLPEEKLAFVENISAGQGGVAMVGDGVNDAPALTRADVGIAIGSASDASAETADVLLMSNDLTRLPYAVQLGRRALTIIRANLVFSVLVVVMLIVLTLLGKLTLTYAVLGHEGSSLLVVANGMRLLGTRPDRLEGLISDGLCKSADSGGPCCCN